MKKCDLCDKKYNLFKTDRLKCWFPSCDRSICDKHTVNDKTYIQSCNECKTMFCEKHINNHGCNYTRKDSSVMYFSPNKNFVIIDVDACKTPAEMAILIEGLEENNYKFIAADINLFFFKIVKKMEDD